MMCLQDIISNFTKSAQKYDKSIDIRCTVATYAVGNKTDDQEF